MKHRQLYIELIDSEMDFLPSGEIELKTIYNLVKKKYPGLCNDRVLCKDICTQGTNQPEWKHRVRTVLNRLKDQELIEKSTQRGYWIINKKNNDTPSAFDLYEGSINPDQLEAKTYRILRDTRLTRQLKRLHSDKCQICDNSIQLKSGKTYSEAHHIKPLSHGGPDIAQNIIILCPNHHVMCDYGAIKLEVSKLRIVEGHIISEEYIKYNN